MNAPEGDPLIFGRLRRRHAQESDNDALADLVADAPEEIDGWEITVERSPDAFAQFRLQDRVDIRYLEDGGIGVAMSVVGGRNCLVGGQRVHVAFVQSYRVRSGHRGKGYSRLVTGMDFPAATPYYNGQVAYVRTRNAAAVGWMKAAVPHAVEGNRLEGDVPGTEVRVEQIAATPPADQKIENLPVRAATRADVAECVELINGTHGGLDLFRPYSAEWFGDRLDEWSWADKPPGHEPVYGWGDFFVLEGDGGVVACAGLWDRGRNMRERWRDLATGTERLIDAACLLDFGFAPGAEKAMADLIRWCTARTAELTRAYLLAPLQWLPDVLTHLGDLQSVPEIRGLIWRGFVPLERPYIDLTFW